MLSSINIDIYEKKSNKIVSYIIFLMLTHFISKWISSVSDTVDEEWVEELWLCLCSATVLTVNLSQEFNNVMCFHFNLNRLWVCLCGLSWQVWIEVIACWRSFIFGASWYITRSCHHTHIHAPTHTYWSKAAQLHLLSTRHNHIFLPLLILWCIK